MKKFLIPVIVIALITVAVFAWVKGTQHTVNVVKEQRHDFIVSLCTRNNDTDTDIKDCIKTIE